MIAATDASLRFARSRLADRRSDRHRNAHGAAHPRAESQRRAECV